MSYAYLQETNPILPMDKTMAQLATITSSVWNTSAASSSPNGVLPPSPTTLLQSRPSTQNKFYQLWRIQSNREPYASEFMVTPYGGVETKLGTNLGTNFKN
jgi:hypothetical protein